jgi:hypothetical protein
VDRRGKGADEEKTRMNYQKTDGQDKTDGGESTDTYKVVEMNNRA